MKLETYILQIKRTDQWRNTEHSSVSISDLKNYCEPGIPHRIIRQKDKLIVWCNAEAKRDLLAFD